MTENKKQTKTFWPYGITIAFVSFAGFIIFIAIFLTGHKFSLVADDYYGQTLDYQERIEEQKRTRALEAQPALSQLPGKLQLSFPDAYAQSVVKGNVMLYRPDDQRSDLSLPLKLSEGGLMALNTEPLKKGLWLVKLDWEMRGQRYHHEEELIL